VQGLYDCVMCRGNALAYADTWSGDDRVPAREKIADYVERMAGRVRPGGHLYLDAPLTVDLEPSEHLLTADGVAIHERVVPEQSRRRWEVSFRREGETTGLGFRRYSSLLTSQRLAGILDDLGFSGIERLAPAGERANFQALLARRATGGPGEPRPGPTGNGPDQRRNVGPL
jgi:hypothetical protein